MTQTAQRITTQIVITPILGTDSFTVRSPHFSEGMYRGGELFQQLTMERDASLDQCPTDTDLLQFVTIYLTPFCSSASTNAGALFGWLQALRTLYRSVPIQETLTFEHPEFEKAFHVGSLDLLNRDLEDLDCDTELANFLAQKMSPQFDQDVRSQAEGELSHDLQRVAGYLCGVVMTILDTATVEEHLLSPVTDKLPVVPQKQHLFSSLLPALLDSNALDKALGVDFQQYDEFSQGYLNGSDQAYSDGIEDHLLTTEQELWTFLSQECAPKVLARERKLDVLHGLTPTPLGYRTGFLAGYLHTMYALQLAEGGNTHD